MHIYEKTDVRKKYIYIYAHIYIYIKRHAIHIYIYQRGNAHINVRMGWNEHSSPAAALNADFVSDFDFAFDECKIESSQEEIYIPANKSK